MIDGIHSVLLAGLDDALARRVVVALGSVGAQFHRAPLAAVLEDPDRTADYDVIIVHHAGDRPTLARLSRLGVAGTARARPGALLVLCGSEWFQEVGSFVGLGVSRVVLLEESDRQLRAAVLSLLAVAPRFQIRTPVRLLSPDEEDDIGAIGSTENISISGMLVSSPRELAVGAKLQFEIPVADGTVPIRGAMEVVRVADPEREGVAGVGARFLSILPSDLELLERLISDQLH